MLRQFASRSNDRAKDAVKEIIEKGRHLNGRLKGIMLDNAALQGARLDKFQLPGSSSRSCNLSRANLIQANFSDCDLRAADLSGAECRRTDFRSANLRWANLEGSALDGANFEGADLRFADLGTHPTDASYFTGALLQLGISPAEARLVQDSSKLIRKSMPAFSQAFYRELFRINPAVRTLFTLNIKDQSQKFAQVFELLVASLDHLDVILPKLKELGQRHAHYRIEPLHYDIAGEALIRTLEKSLGPHFDEEVKHAWAKVYQLVSLVMQDAAA
ncbi:MAG: pentapeptide repeat-containing protein [Phaeodactylibacter sp.]|nr:pentapeptide repeat-containing protein [Phaeodactylibacter sp.]